MPDFLREMMTTSKVEGRYVLMRRPLCGFSREMEFAVFLSNKKKMGRLRYRWAVKRVRASLGGIMKLPGDNVTFVGN